jgi:hypothetical protein
MIFSLTRAGDDGTWQQIQFDIGIKSITEKQNTIYGILKSGTFLGTISMALSTNKNIFIAGRKAGKEPTVIVTAWGEELPVLLNKLDLRQDSKFIQVTKTCMNGNNLRWKL